MCLFKVFIDKGSSKELVAEGISIVKKDMDKIELYNNLFDKIATIKKVEIVNVDAMDEILILKEE